MADKRLNTRAAGIVAAAVLCSRFLGLARELIVAALFGASKWMDAFIVAFRAPNLLRDLFAEGALSTAFITIFSKKIEQEGKESAWQLAAKMATMVVIFMSLITLAGVIFAPGIVRFLAPDFAADQTEFAILLTRIMFPFILMVSLAALVMGMLNANNVFGIPALASSFFNIGSIAGGLFFGWLIDPAFGHRALIGLAIGTLLGGLLQLAVQLPSLRRAGFVFRSNFAWRDEGVSRVLMLMIPSVIAGSAVQVNVMVNTIFASYLQDGAISWLNYAFRLMMLPLGVFGVAVATVTLPVVSKIAATMDWESFRNTLSKALRLGAFLAIPSAAGLAMLAEPVIGLIYERGRFGWTDTLATAGALRFYALGLIGYCMVKVLAPAFYAMDRKWTPMTVSFASIAINCTLNYILIFEVGWGHRGLALSTAISATFNAVLLYVILRRHTGGLRSAYFLRQLTAYTMGAAGLCVTAWLWTHYAEAWLLRSELWVRLPAVLASIATSGGVYLLICWVLRVEEIQEIKAILLRRLRRG